MNHSVVEAAVTFFGAQRPRVTSAFVANLQGKTYWLAVFGHDTVLYANETGVPRIFQANTAFQGRLLQVMAAFSAKADSTLTQSFKRELRARGFQ